MRLGISGSHGLIGSALLSQLGESHECFRLRRAGPGFRVTAVDGDETLPWSVLAGGAVVHLAGRSIACPWTAANRREIRDSRVARTRWLATAMATQKVPPLHFLCASAVGYYGDRGDTMLTEEANGGEGFLPSVCKEWEAACEPADAVGVRVVNMRLGAVLSRQGGMLAAMLPAFRLGLGGRLGSGTQFVSWITLDDVVGTVAHLLATPSLRGPVNVCAPRPVTNREFVTALGQVLRRPTVLPVPGFLLRLLPGPMAAELLLVSTRAIPRALENSAMTFRHPEIDGALEAVL